MKDVKIFDVGDHDCRTTISLPKTMEEALKLLALMKNEKVSRIIVNILEAYLIELAEAGTIPWPEAYKDRLKQIKRASY